RRSSLAGFRRGVSGGRCWHSRPRARTMAAPARCTSCFAGRNSEFTAENAENAETVLALRASAFSAFSAVNSVLFLFGRAQLRDGPEILERRGVALDIA